MAKKTKDIKHYEIYTVRRNFTIKREGREIVNMEELAIFDDNSLAEAFIAQRGALVGMDKGLVSESYEIQPTWVDKVPKAENFNIPFNQVLGKRAENKVATKKPKQAK